LRSIEDAVPIGVLVDQEFNRFLDFRPIAFEERIVRRHLMFSVGSQNHARLSVDGRSFAELRPKVN
jgi:hypothetical protein